MCVLLIVGIHTGIDSLYHYAKDYFNKPNEYMKDAVSSRMNFTDTQ